MTTSTGNSDTDNIETAHQLLGNPRRRYLLYHLMDNGVGNLEELSLQIAAWEQDESVEDVSEESREHVAISLVHNHLPRLADHGFADYDLRSGDIVLTDKFAEIEPFVDVWKQTVDSADAVDEVTVPALLPSDEHDAA